MKRLRVLGGENVISGVPTASVFLAMDELAVGAVFSISGVCSTGLL